VALSYTGTGNPSNFILEITGDGVSDTIVIELEKAPLNLDLRGNLPVSIIVSFSLGTLRLVGGGKSLEVKFSSPPVNESVAVIFPVLMYKGK